MLTVLLGGARSGKSALALEIAGRGGGPVVFVATAEALDDEIAARIERHRAERPRDWTTLEEPLDLDSALGAAPGEVTVVLDCLTIWVANLLGAGGSDEEVLGRAGRVARTAAGRAGATVVVSNEVGSGIVPLDALSRRYRDLLGKVNATFAAMASDAYLVVAGRLLALERPGDLVVRAEGPSGT